MNLIHQFNVGPKCTECQSSRRPSKFHLSLYPSKKCKQRFSRNCTCKADETTPKPTTSKKWDNKQRRRHKLCLGQSHKKLQRKQIVQKRENVEQFYLKDEKSDNDI